MIKISNNRNLIIAAVGDHSLHRNWLSYDFDTCLIYYGNQSPPKEPVKYLIEDKGPKYTLIKRALENNPNLLDYNNVWMPDDDVWLKGKEVSTLFSFMDLFELKLAQPAIVGHYSLEVTLPFPSSRLRFTNFVEIMCPCFSRDALQKCHQTFDENKSGWSYDALWDKLLGRPQRGIAIIDDVIAVHTRPIFGGELYQSQNIKSPMQEGRELFKKHQLAEGRTRALKFGQIVCSEAYGTVIYHTVPKSTEETVPKQKRFWPPVESWKDCVAELRRKDPT